MEPRKAFWHALITVGVPFLIWGVLLSAMGIGPDWWLVEAIFVILPALGLFGLVYNRYLKSPAARLTPRAYLIRAIVMGCLGIGYLVLAAVGPRAGWRSVPYWTGAGVSLLITLDHLRHAYKAKETVAVK